MPDSAVNLDPVLVADRLRPVLLRLNRHLKRELQDLGVTPTQVSLLVAIHNEPGIGIGELADRERMTTPTVSGHIDRLEALELVERQRGASADRRRIGLATTSGALDLLHRVKARRTDWLAARLQDLAPAHLAAIDAAIDPLRHLLESRP